MFLPIFPLTDGTLGNETLDFARQEFAMAIKHSIQQNVDNEIK